MKKIMTIMLFTSMTLIQMNAAISAQKDVTLTVSADGVSKEDAIKNALRSAIEQTYGTFVSSNTSLLNDELVKDEIVTVSSGSIKKYKELILDVLPNGRVYVTLQATISISKLVTYAKSKGATVEFDGASLAMNIQMEKLNMKSQDEVLKNLAIQAKSLLYKGYNYSLEVLRIESSNFKQGVKILLEVKASPNKNFKKAIALIHQTLKNLHVPLGRQVSTIKYDKLKVIEEHSDWSGTQTQKKVKEYMLRNSPGVNEWLISMENHLDMGIINYTIQDDTGMHSVLEWPRRGEVDCIYKEYYYAGINDLIGKEKIRYNNNDRSFEIKIITQKRTEEIFMFLESQSELSKYNDFKIQCLGEWF